ncbi:MAG: hypothetical protein AUJ98_01660 [Bacteroidetes bacterium CG2_30_33_31]|nr:MAG: hypothetical protein AUJ98_01660 [Bacteroidetes bacterium CG2_30_33_31]
METVDILKKVRKIEIKSRGLSNQIFSGHYHSAFKGRGMAFSEVREYQFGDDIRFIDWNVTARFHHPFIKVFEEEREMTVMLLIDVSASNHFGTQKAHKEDVITEIAAVLSFSAIANNDKVGVIFFSDIIEKFIPPAKGSKHILRIIHELINFKATSNKTNISEAFKYLTNVIKKRSTVFVISDFMDFKYKKAMQIASRKHDLAALQIFDIAESRLTDVGLIKINDPETGKEHWIDTSFDKVRKTYGDWWIKHQEELKATFNSAGVDWVNISTNDDYVKPLLKLFRMRESRF